MKVVLEKGAFKPKRAYDDDAGLDLFTPVDVIIPAGRSVVIDTGVHMQINRGYFGKIESKSGLNINHSVVSCGGVIDSGYTGSVVVKLYNLGDEGYAFKSGEKIAQIIIQPCVGGQFEEVESIEEKERGSNGFGSTGK